MSTVCQLVSQTTKCHVFLKTKHSCITKTLSQIRWLQNKAAPCIKMPLRHHETQKIPLKHHETVWHDQHYNNPITSSR